MKCISWALSTAVPFLKQILKNFRSLEAEIMMRLVCQRALAVFSLSRVSTELGTRGSAVKRSFIIFAERNRLECVGWRNFNFVNDANIQPAK